MKLLASIIALPAVIVIINELHSTMHTIQVAFHAAGF